MSAHIVFSWSAWTVASSAWKELMPVCICWSRASCVAELWFNSLCAELFRIRKNKRNEICIFLFIFFNCLPWRPCKLLKFILKEKKSMFNIQCQCHTCWCPGDRRSQGINRPGIDSALVEYSGSSTQRVQFVSLTYQPCLMKFYNISPIDGW